MRTLTITTLCGSVLLVVALVALHAPGEMSVDSVMALYEALQAHAIGWGPTFMAATLGWLGGGAIGAAFFVALMCLMTYGCFVALLLDRANIDPPRWQVVVAFLIALNPLFMFYVGIVWKDVMQATFAMTSATLLLVSTHRTGRMRYVLLGASVIAASVLIPVRQQGILIAIPLGAAAGLVAIGGRNARAWHKFLAVIGAVAVTIVISAVLYFAAAIRVTPQANGPFAVGVFTIQAYDIAGMVANAPKNDTSTWAHMPAEVRKDVRAQYSPERIDTIWHIEPIRKYFNSLSREQYLTTWINGIAHAPATYIETRLTAFAYLLGMSDLKGCVPAFWGIGALQDQVAALGLTNGMDPRARFIGQTATRLYNSPIFRNWFYALLLVAATVICVFGRLQSAKAAPVGVLVGAWLYWLSFIPTSIACDVRYLYPVACLASVALIYFLTHARLLPSGTGRRATSG